MLLLGTSHDTSLLVIANSLLEEVGLASQGDVLHEVEWVGRSVDFVVTQSEEETISNELDVLLHESGVHSQESTWKSLGQKFLLDFYSFGDDILNGLLGWAMLKMGEEEACKVSVKAFITGDEFVGESESSHETTLLKPEDGGEGSGEENTFNGGESDETLSKSRILVLDPFDSPVGLLLDARNYQGC